MMRRSTLKALGARYGSGFLRAPGVANIEIKNLAEDYWLFAQLALQGLCANLPDTLIRYRRHDTSVGVTKFEAQMAISEDISDHLMTVVATLHDEKPQSVRPFCNHGARLAPSTRTASCRPNGVPCVPNCFASSATRRACGANWRFVTCWQTGRCRSCWPALPGFA